MSDLENMNFDVTQTTPLVCQCGNHTFEPAMFLREISAIVSPTGKAGILPVPTFVCIACGTPPDKVIPQFIKTATAVPESALDAPRGFTPSKLTLL